jgi:hypothetical protein
MHPQANLQFSSGAPVKGLLQTFFLQKNLNLPFDMKKPQISVTVPPASRLSTDKR